jgi:hypothetical protein
MASIKSQIVKPLHDIKSDNVLLGLGAELGHTET